MKALLHVSESKALESRKAFMTESAIKSRTKSFIIIVKTSSFFKRRGFGSSAY